MKRIFFLAPYFLCLILFVYFGVYQFLAYQYPEPFREQIIYAISATVLCLCCFLIGNVLFKNELIPATKRNKNILLFANLFMVFMAAAYAVQVEYRHDHAFLIEQQILFVASTFSVLGLVALFSIQNRGVLNFKIVNFLALLFSVFFLLGTAFLFYPSFDYYNTKKSALQDILNDKKIQQEHINAYMDSVRQTAFKYTEYDLHAFEILTESANDLQGYETYIEETFNTDYGEGEQTKANRLKQGYIDILSSKAYSQEYWDDILSNVFSYDPETQTYDYNNYDLQSYDLTTGTDMDLSSANDMNHIVNMGIYQYWLKKAVDPENRAAEQIEWLWQENKGFIFNYFPKAKYNALCKTLVDDLIEIKTKINRQPDYREFYETYSVEDSFFFTYPSKAFVNSYPNAWAFGFWDRRYEEENDELVYQILLEIQNHYNGL